MRHSDELERRMAKRMQSMDSEKKFFGGMVVFIFLINAAWIGFLIWAIYTLVTHFTS